MAPASSHPAPGKTFKLSWPNQRATVRYRCPPATAGKIYVADDLEFQRAWLQDLSRAGMGLLLAKPLDRGLAVTIQMKSPNSNKGYSLAAHVMHATQHSSGDWMIGVEFVEPLTCEDLDDLL